MVGAGLMLSPAPRNSLRTRTPAIPTPRMQPIGVRHRFASIVEGVSKRAQAIRTSPFSG